MDYTTDKGRIAHMDFDLHPASDYPLTDLVSTLNRGFENYFVPIHLTPSSLNEMIRKDSIDLDASRILLVDNSPKGIALIARRRGSSRLAAMGIAAETRGNHAGTWFMERLLEDADLRGDRAMFLEVITQNTSAVRLYQKFGFQVMRNLVGFVYAGVAAQATDSLDEISLQDLGRLIVRHGLPDLPWQLAGETISLMAPPVRAYRKGHAYAAISNPRADHVVIWSLLVEPQVRGRGLGVDMLTTVMAHHARNGERAWHIPAIYPEEFSSVFERAGFTRESLSQWQMILPLSKSVSDPGV